MHGDCNYRRQNRNLNRMALLLIRLFALRMTFQTPKWKKNKINQRGGFPTCIGVQAEIRLGVADDWRRCRRHAHYRR